MIDEENILPDDTNDLPLPDPQEFREPLEEGAQADATAMSESPGVELPEPPQDSINEMESMGSDADAEQSLDQPPPEIPPEEPTASPTNEGPEPPASPSMAEVGRQEEPPSVGDLESMGAAASAEQNVEQIPTQDTSVLESIGSQQRQQFEMDYGSPETGDAGMEAFEAMSREKDVEFLWQRLVTQKIIDHTHLLEQLLMMLEADR